ncbi:DnaT-like ssDNA-binding protein [Pseudomonas cremoricolorata]|uniref:Protein singed n=1 Tax=Pseudomonas cremoricolorata TaxID=157783 RepID=A0A089WMI3_9PSED|nr:DnaT-like ssDNA-binding protein [Pseudomonas cremoricolorata]AIR90520.1 protein singed [Pseudomonas cremoricolorata]
MATYITVADVDALLGSAWSPEEKKALAVMQANAYLTSLSLVGIDMDAIPEEVKMAGAQLAQAAAAGTLYQQHTEGSLEAKTVKAGSVSTSRTYASLDRTSASAQPEAIQFALVLLTPWRGNAFSFAVNRG